MSQSTIKNAVITDAVLDTGDRGFLTSWISLDYGGSGQGFGGYVLYLPKSFDHHKIPSVAGHFIFRVMQVAGVNKWSELKGKTIRVRGTHSHIEAIGHIVKDDWFCPAEDFKELS